MSRKALAGTMMTLWLLGASACAGPSDHPGPPAQSDQQEQLTPTVYVDLARDVADRVDERNERLYGEP